MSGRESEEWFAGVWEMKMLYVISIAGRPNYDKLFQYFWLFTPLNEGID